MGWVAHERVAFARMGYAWVTGHYRHPARWWHCAMLALPLLADAPPAPLAQGEGGGRHSEAVACQEDPQGVLRGDDRAHWDAGDEAADEVRRRWGWGEAGGTQTCIRLSDR